MSLASCVHLLEGMEPGVAGVDGDAGPAAGGRERGGHEANIVDDRPEAEPSGLAVQCGRYAGSQYPASRLPSLNSVLKSRI